MIEEPASMEPEEILLKYVDKMEEIIRKEPEYYLWSHRRWKHTRPVDTPLIERKQNIISKFNLVSNVKN